MTQYSDFDKMMLAASAVVPAVAAALAYLISWLAMKRSHKLAKTIAFETINQNTSTAVAFVTISYSGPLLGELLPAAAFSGLFAICWTCLAIIVHRLVILVKSKDTKDDGKSLHSSTAENNVVEGIPNVSAVSEGQTNGTAEGNTNISTVSEGQKNGTVEGYPSISTVGEGQITHV